MAGQSERDILERLRREFQSQGYTVETQADVFSTADRSQPVRADLSARKGGEVVLVGIKPMGADAGTAARMEALARAAEDHPEWRFRLVVADSPLTQRLDLPEPGVIRERLADVRRLARKGDRIPAMLYLWGLFTAAAARRLEAFNVTGTERDAPDSLVRTLIAQGLADQSDSAWLLDVADMQAAFSTGRIHRPFNDEAFDRLCTLTNTLAMARRGEIEAGRNVTAP